MAQPKNRRVASEAYVDKRAGFAEDLAGEPGTRRTNMIIDPWGIDPVNTYSMIGGTLQTAPGPWGRAIGTTGGGANIDGKSDLAPGEGTFAPVSVGDAVATRVEIRAMPTQKLSATLFIHGYKWDGTAFSGPKVIDINSGQLHIEANQTVTFEALGTITAEMDITHVMTRFTFRRFGETFPTIGDFIYFRRVALYAGENAPTAKPIPYFDGATANSYWVGEPNNSQSVTMQPREIVIPPAADIGLTHAVLLDDYSYRRGGTKRIPGKTSISFRVDHGLANFDSKMRPKLEAHEFPYALALNSRAWGNSENAGITASIVNGWFASGLPEMWNHGPSHADTSDEPTIFDYIVNTKTELETQIPACAPIDGYMPPGASGAGGYGGFIPVNTPAQYYGTYAGRLVLEHYAIGTGGFPGTAYRVQDGRPRVGQSYFNMDTFTATQIIGRVNNAIAAGQGIQLMIHPSLIDTPGYTTTADIHSVLDQIKALQDAGTVVVMSAYDQLLADSTD